MLEEDEEKEVHKVHRYFGHRHGRKVWELFAKAGRLKGKKEAVMKLLENCNTCKQLKKTPPRPRIGMPVANSFNEVVGLDLKILPNGQSILWMVDLFSKVIKGKLISDKNPETIVQAIIEKWIVGDGFGPGHPSRFFYSDNGGEFLNNEVINFAASQDTVIKMTAASSPWQNGIVERHHATADIIFDKIRMENPGMSGQEIIDRASMAKNCEVGRSGFSPLQIVMGQCPVFPGLGQVTPASNNFESSSKTLRTLRNIDDIRVKYRQYDCDEKLKKLRSQKINPAVEREYKLGDPVLFRDTKKKEWKQGIALVRFGKTLYLKFGNFLRRVPIDTVIPDSDRANKDEEAWIDSVETEDDEGLQFTDQDENVDELVKDLEIERENQLLKDQVVELQQKVHVLSSDNNKEIASSRLEIGKKRAERRKEQKLRKAESRKMYPLLGQQIRYREKGSDEWVIGKVFRVFKKSSIHKNVKQLLLEDGSRIEKNFETDVDEWELYDPMNEDEDCDPVGTDSSLFSFVPHDSTYQVDVVSKEDYGQQIVKDAMKDEIAKYREFNAFEEVEDAGQKSVPIRWVVTRKNDDGKNQPVKARMCIRGDLEKNKEYVRADSPSAGKETLRLALMIAANEGFSVKGADIKSAYLQGQELDRQIFVRPPPEADAEGKLWLLKKAAYGVLDGGRLFYLRLVEELARLGLHKVHADGALFTYVKNGTFHGLVASVVDDLIIAGDEVFEAEVEKKLQNIFVFSKVEVGKFKFCGCNVRVDENGAIELDQNDYVEKIDFVKVDEDDESRRLCQREQKILRGKVGELLWVSLLTRPDLAFEVNWLSANIAQATVKSLKLINSVIRKAKSKKEIIKFTRLGNLSDLSVKVYTDASFSNQEDKIRSTGGRVIFIENTKTGRVNILSWKTKKIARVCRSVKSAETRALDEGIDDAVNTARIFKEIYTGNNNFRNPDQIPVTASIDNKSLWENLHNTRQCEEKMLRNTIASIKESIELGYVKEISWVPTNLQYADCMTKKTSDTISDKLLKIASLNSYS